MTQIDLEGLCLDSGLGRPASVATLSSNATRIALVGDWSSLFDYLMGNGKAVGNARFFGEDARRSVISGSTAVVHPALIPPWKETARSWLIDQLQILGHPAAQAEERTAEVLAETDLGHLAERRLGSLDGVQQFAIQLAAALLAKPKVIAISETPGVPEAADFERFLIERIAPHGILLIGCDPLEQIPLFLSCEESWAVGPNGAMCSHQPIETFERTASYVLTALRNGEALERMFRGTGVLVHSIGTNELIVTLPSGKSTNELLRMAANADAPLSRMLPLQLENSHVRSQNRLS